MKAVIIDDEINARAYLRNLAEKHIPELEIIGEADDTKSGIELLKNENPDVIFLDVEMPSGTGFSLLDSLDEIKFHTIITTGHKSYALKAIKYMALDFLVKPYDLEELRQAVSKAESKNRVQAGLPFPNKMEENYQSKNFDQIALFTGNAYEVVKLENMIAVEADGNYTKVYIKDKKMPILVSKKLREFEEIMPPQHFTRIHRSALINLKHLQKFVQSDGGYVIMDNDVQLSVSKNRKDALIERLRIM